MHPAHVPVAERRRPLALQKPRLLVGLDDMLEVGGVAAVHFRQVGEGGLDLQRPEAAGRGGDEGSPALLRREQPLSREDLDRLAHRDPPDAELFHQPVDRRNRLVLLPGAAADAVPQHAGDLRIARERVPFQHSGVRGRLGACRIHPIIGTFGW